MLSSPEGPNRLERLACFHLLKPHEGEMSEHDGTQPTVGNPFVPDDLGTAPPSRRRDYASHLLHVREQLTERAEPSDEGEALDALIEEVDAALGLLQDTDPAPVLVHAEAAWMDGHDLHRVEHEAYGSLSFAETKGPWARTCDVTGESIPEGEPHLRAVYAHPRTSAQGSVMRGAVRALRISTAGWHWLRDRADALALEGPQGGIPPGGEPPPTRYSKPRGSRFVTVPERPAADVVRRPAKRPFRPAMPLPGPGQQRPEVVPPAVNQRSTPAG
jgi:hypothetical protein